MIDSTPFPQSSSLSQLIRETPGNLPRSGDSRNPTQRKCSSISAAYPGDGTTHFNPHSFNHAVAFVFRYQILCRRDAQITSGEPGLRGSAPLMDRPEPP
ncbi:hypothetical protein CDAR_599201 [Caerostris darwini]|uniref:Uncharacterized protein n=1 Tax=Caerostris darwini TaxID=1538125 RepID=A0AAV4R8A4_9ARAC|nr:hypothetical protein CDAR_599201 [Caerostris darwini]